MIDTCFTVRELWHRTNSNFHFPSILKQLSFSATVLVLAPRVTFFPPKTIANNLTEKIVDFFLIGWYFNFNHHKKAFCLTEECTVVLSNRVIFQFSSIIKQRPLFSDTVRFDTRHAPLIEQFHYLCNTFKNNRKYFYLNKKSNRFSNETISCTRDLRVGRSADVWVLVVPIERFFSIVSSLNVVSPDFPEPVHDGDRLTMPRHLPLPSYYPMQPTNDVRWPYLGTFSFLSSP